MKIFKISSIALSALSIGVRIIAFVFGKIVHVPYCSGCIICPHFQGLHYILESLLILSICVYIGTFMTRKTLSHNIKLLCSSLLLGYFFFCVSKWISTCLCECNDYIGESIMFGFVLFFVLLGIISIIIIIKKLKD